MPDSENASFLLASKHSLVQEISIAVPWGRISGKWWGRSDCRPILTLHGWQDNCGSFDRIIPLLVLTNGNIAFLVIDLPGHGYSSRIPPGMYYHYINYTILIEFIVNYFEWPKVSLMGHSMGGSACFIYCSLFPNKVDFFISIDGLKPPIPEDHFNQMPSIIENFFRYDVMANSENEPPSYSMDEIKQKICAPNNDSIAPEHSSYLIKRSTAPSKLYPGKFYFTRDPRLKCDPLLVPVPQQNLVEYATAIRCPVFVVKTKNGSFYEPEENFYEVLNAVKKSSKYCEFHYVKGRHHTHLNNPEELANLISEFIKKCNTEDQSIGEIKKEIFKNELQISKL